MAQRGTVEGIQGLQSKAGKRYYKLQIDGQEHLAFGRTADSCGSIQTGDQVEFSAKPTDSGDASMLTFIKKTAGGPAGPKAQAGAHSNTTTPRPAYSGRSQDPTMQLSILYGYAKDLVAAGVVTTPAPTPEAVADLVSTVARALMFRFKLDANPDIAPTPQEAPRDNSALLPSDAWAHQNATRAVVDPR